ncbi:hypothetical protein ATK74_1406 [Propionicimonas paludicola]|uniref:Uncharacterized protein n=1 Tax=Propionicimonas paludicola TaxID=185243 RepID=A0A2A9CRN0_9ACTN|nr:hypothetical protein ATK74_1406 [Propionicimonas paludicola]
MPASSRSVRLTPGQLGYLMSAPYLDPALRSLVDESVSTQLHNSLSIGSDAAEDLRSALTLRLAAVGFDSSYALTAEGRLVEYLIDALAGS